MSQTMELQSQLQKIWVSQGMNIWTAALDVKETKQYIKHRKANCTSDRKKQKTQKTKRYIIQSNRTKCDACSTLEKMEHQI